MASIIKADTLQSTTANVFVLNSSGTEYARFDSSGNLGIGTASPAQQLNVVTTSNGAIRQVGIRNLSSGSAAYSILNVGNDTGELALDIGVLSSTNATYGGINSAVIQSNYGNMMFGTSSAYAAQFITSGLERMRINAGAPILCLAGGSTTATGTGIAFPATQSASSDANTLDDYEEGTWTPTIGADSVDGTHTYSNQSGAYTKVGRLVTVQCLVVMATKGGTISGNVQIVGLPFSAGGATFVETASVGYFSNLATNVVMLKAYINSSATRINMSKMAAAGVNMTQMVAADASATTALYVSASYYTT